jgi:hypothetical protein
MANFDLSWRYCSERVANLEMMMMMMIMIMTIVGVEQRPGRGEHVE